MSEPVRIITVSEDQLREIVRAAVAEALQANGNGSTQPRDWLKAEELAALYGLPRTWFEERGRAGDIARTKPGRYVLFKRRDVEAYLERHKTKNELDNPTGKVRHCVSP